MIDLRLKLLPTVRPDRGIQDWETGRCDNCALGSLMDQRQVLCTKYNQICRRNQTCKSYEERK